MTVENVASHAARIVENVLLNQVQIQKNICYSTVTCIVLLNRPHSKLGQHWAVRWL